MEPQPCTWTAEASKDAAGEAGPTSNSVEVDEAQVLTSGDPIPAPQQQQGEQIFFNCKTSFKQIHKKYNGACRPKGPKSENASAIDSFEEILKGYF